MHMNLDEYFPLYKIIENDQLSPYNTTSFPLKKSTKHQKYAFNNLVTYRSQKEKKSSKNLIVGNETTSKTLDETQTPLMKNYLNKLKRPQNFRKRKIPKKLHKSQGRTSPLSKNNSPSKIALLDSIHKHSNNGMNTVSVVMKDMYEITSYGENKSRKTSTPIDNSPIKKDKVNISTSNDRKSSFKQLSVDHILEGKSQFLQRDLARRILASKRKQSQRFCNLKSEKGYQKVEGKKKSTTQNHFKVLEPWKQEKNHDDFLEEYEKH